MAYKTTNPYTGEVLKTFETLSDQELEAKLQKAQTAFESWSKTSFDERARVLRKAAELMLERREEYGAINTLMLIRLKNYLPLIL